jgi:hypothetical protein
MSTLVTVPALQSTTLNSSDAYEVALGLSSHITVERNAGTPAGDAVNVVFDSVSAALLSSITVQDASLTIGSLANASVLTSFNIGNAGKLDLSDTIGLNVASPITFEGIGGILVLDQDLDLRLLSSVQGFNQDDVLNFTDIPAATSVDYAGGRVIVYNGSTEVASVAVNGDFNGDLLGLQADGRGGFNVGVGLGNGGGLPNDVFATGLHSQYIVAQTSLGQLYLQDQVAGRDAPATVSDGHFILFADGVGRFDATGSAEEVAHLYQAAFDRRPDAGGLDFWANQLDAGTSTGRDVASAFTGTSEFQATYAGLDNTAFVQRLYNNVLDRDGEAGGVAFWADRLGQGETRGDVLLGFSESFENVVRTTSFTGDREYGQAYRLYEAALDREPEAAGLQFWFDRLQGGASLTSVSQNFVDSVEFNDRYGTLNDHDFVNTLYQNVLERPADQIGSDYWVNSLQNGSTRADVLLGFSDSLEGRILTADATHDSWVFLGAG